MKRAFSIVLALALVMTMMVASAAPAAAVSAGTVKVTHPSCDNIAGQNMTYTITFHNRELLQGWDGVHKDYIDVAFPAGTGLPFPATFAVFKGASATTATTVVAISHYTVATRTMRFYLEDEAFIEKSNWVRIVIEDVTNPPSCDYFLQVGTSNVTPEPSNTYTIFTAKVDLVPGKNLISLPAYPRDTSIQVVLAQLFAKAVAEAAMPTPFTFSVWYWDSWAQEWVIYASDTSFNDLTTMEAGKAYFIKVNKEITFKFKGDPYPECQGPPQKWCYPPSWSMIGPAIQDSEIWASEYLKDALLPWPHQNTYAVTSIIAFNATTQQFMPTSWNPGTADNVPAWMTTVAAWPAKSDYELEQMRGYFMSFAGEACIIPPIP